MSATLFGERFLGRREPAWHRLGEVFPADEKLTATEAMTRVDMMFNVDKYQQYIQLPDGTYLPTKSFSVVREPTTDDNEYRVLATVGKEWTALQATDLGNMLDPISVKYPVETAGAIGHGEKIFISLDAGDAKIAGEDHNLYWLVSDARDGTGSLSIAFTPVRVVCQNTLVAGLSSAKVSINIKHQKSIHHDTEFYLSIFGEMASIQQDTVSAMDSLASVTIDEQQVKSIIHTAYPNASRPARLNLSDGIKADDVPATTWLKILNDRKGKLEQYEARQLRVQNIRDHANTLYETFNDVHTNLARTPWAVYNAVVENEDYRRGHDQSDTMLFGSRAESKAKAFSKALSLV